MLYCFQENKSGAPSCLQEKGTGALLISGERNWCSTVFRRRKLVLYSFNEKGTGALSITVLMIGEGTSVVLFSRERNRCTAVLKDKETGALLF